MTHFNCSEPPQSSQKKLISAEPYWANSNFVVILTTFISIKKFRQVFLTNKIPYNAINSHLRIPLTKWTLPPWWTKILGAILLSFNQIWPHLLPKRANLRFGLTWAPGGQKSQLATCSLWLWPRTNSSKFHLYFTPYNTLNCHFGVPLKLQNRPSCGQISKWVLEYLQV